jgi:GT2 family glycosyltransferase
MTRISIIVSVDPLHPVHGFSHGCAQQSRPFDDFEVIVVDSQRRPEISEALEQARTTTRGALDIQYLTIDKTNRAALNNFGVARASGELIAFNCNDFIPGPNYIDAHLQFHEQNPDPRFVGIGPGISPDHQRNASAFLRWLEDSGKLFGFNYRDEGAKLPESYFTVSNASLKKAFLLEAGGFDESFPYPAWDDYEMGVRLTRHGMKAQLVPEAVAIHDHLVTFSERVQALRRAGESVAMFAEKTNDRLVSKEPMWKYSLRRLGLLFGKRATLRERAWELLLDGAFVWGYMWRRARGKSAG